MSLTEDLELRAYEIESHQLPARQEDRCSTSLKELDYA